VIAKDERDRRIAEIDRESNVFQRLLMESIPEAAPQSVDELQAVLEPLAEWEFLERDDKRALLQAICPEITVFRYTVRTLMINFRTESAGSYDVSHLKTGR
jgi:type III secretory pathway component EscV